ncbi:hypothetical protein PoB_001892000 [Plakobranchus ocellatus]|uniref:Uncharacterized protein n=1 Tax=Plakobranchus ocellatus TaxID=259542 RepID=A0AAV3ZB81_9GAST|nr:hypothetical protein PoB_001892000 [Plakobranchus ocellatus]
MLSQVINRENVLEAAPLTTQLLQVPITIELCPITKVVVEMTFFEESEGLSMTDDIIIKPRQCLPAEVEVSFDSETALTGTETKMQLQLIESRSGETIPGVYDVYYMAVDRRSNLLYGSTALGVAKVKFA